MDRGLDCKGSPRAKPPPEDKVDRAYLALIPSEVIEKSHLSSFGSANGCVDFSRLDA